MTEVNNLTNIAREIVSKLDADDKKSDGKIEASIWNKFVCSKQGNEIHNYINKENALKSVIAYIKRETTKTWQQIEDIANECLGKVVGETYETQIDTNSSKTDNKLEISYINVKSLVEPYGTEEYTNKMAQNPEYWEKTKEKFANIFDNSCQLLLDVAENNYRYKITKGCEHNPQWGKDGNYTAKLADRRTIEISLAKSHNNSIYLSSVFIYDDKKAISLSMEGNTLFVKSGEDKGTIQSANANKNTSDDMGKLVEKIFGEEIKKDFGDNIDYVW